MTEGHNDRNDLSRNDRSDSSCDNSNQSVSLVKRRFKSRARFRLEVVPSTDAKQIITAAKVLQTANNKAAIAEDGKRSDVRNVR